MAVGGRWIPYKILIVQLLFVFWSFIGKMCLFPATATYTLGVEVSQYNLAIKVLLRQNVGGPYTSLPYSYGGRSL